MYSGYRTAFDWKGVLIEKSFSWSFVDDLARNIVIFYADNKSSSHSNNCKNNTLILGEGPPSDINSRFGFPEKKKLVIILMKQIFAQLCIIIVITVIWLFMKKKPISLKLKFSQIFSD